MRERMEALETNGDRNDDRREQSTAMTSALLVH
jgi:hypothetical protein